jgi:acyl-CoA thioester hydrolase
MTEAGAGWLEGREHVLPVRIYYEDTDFTGAVYHANYLRYFERGRSDYLRVIGVSHQVLLALPEPLAFTVARLELDFKRSARIDDALLVRTTFDSFKGPRLYVHQRLFRGEELLCELSGVVACIDMAGRPKKPPQTLVSALQPLLG